MEATTKVVAMLPSPGAANEDFARAAVTPVGRPDQARLMAELKMPV